MVEAFRFVESYELDLRTSNTRCVRPCASHKNCVAYLVYLSPYYVMINSYIFLTRLRVAPGPTRNIGPQWGQIYLSNNIHMRPGSLSA
jgi:hypothetical protein